MSPESKRLSGILLIIMPTVIYGGISILSFLINDPSYQQNALRQDLFRAGHAHAGVLLILSLVTLRYVDEANLSQRWKQTDRHSIPLSAILLPAAFFFSVLKAEATKPNNLIYLAYAGALLLAFGLIIPAIGLLRKPKVKI